MATSHQFKDEINDLTECAICTETFLQPKVIPCLHTFCLKCLETYCAGTKPGNSMECPLCRGKFTIPAGGVSKLRNNIYVEKLIEAGLHLKSKSPVLLGLCGCRSGKVNSMYCRDCNVAACHKCKHQNHSGHNTTDIVVYVKQCQQQIYEDVNKVEAIMANLNVHTKETDDNFSMLKNTFTKTKADIEARSTNLKRQIEEQTQLLLAELRQFETDELEKIEQIKKHRNDITEKCQNFLQFAECSNDDNCASSDLIQLSNDLHAYAEDLFGQFESFAKKRIDDSVNIYFEQSAEDGVVGKIQKHSSNNTRVRELNDRQNTIIGNVLLQPPPLMNSLETVTLCEPVTTTSLQQEYSSRHSTDINDINFLKSWTASPDKDTEIGDVAVMGVVSIHKRLYVAIENSNAIKVFDCTSLGYIESITVGPLRCPYDLTGYGSLLYISESEHAEIHKFRLAQTTSDTWSVDGTAFNLSMTNQQNVIGTSCEKNGNFIVVFSRYGQRLQIINLDQDIRNLQHAICLSNGELVVCHGEDGDDLRRICLIDCDGRMIKSFGGAKSTDVGHLNEPQRLASYSDGLILILDYRNNNVQILNENLEFVGELVLKSSGLYMWTMCMNERTGQLFIVADDDQDNFRITSFKVGYK